MDVAVTWTWDWGVFGKFVILALFFWVLISFIVSLIRLAGEDGNNMDEYGHRRDPYTFWDIVSSSFFGIGVMLLVVVGIISLIIGALVFVSWVASW